MPAIEGKAARGAIPGDAMHRTRSRSSLLRDPVRSFSRDLSSKIDYHAHCPEDEELLENESRRPSTEAGQLQSRAYLHYLQEERKLAWTSCNVAACGLAFFYTRVLGWDQFRLDMPPRKRALQLPDILSRQELEQLFRCTKNPKHQGKLFHDNTSLSMH